MTDCLFCRIVGGEIPSERIYEDDQVIAIRDINPQAPVHLLLIPKKPIDRLSNAQPEDQALLGHMMLAACKIARQLKIENAFRLAINNGAEAGQSVFHLHMHILAGRALSWPPG